jgi:hypothetical protein
VLTDWADIEVASTISNADQKKKIAIIRLYIRAPCTQMGDCYKGIPDRRQLYCLSPDELWQRVQARLAIVKNVYARENGGLRAETMNPSYLFSGLLKCTECGRI